VRCYERREPSTAPDVGRGFLAWPTPDGSSRWALIDGAPVAMAPASDRHALIHAETTRLIGNHLAEHRQDCAELSSNQASDPTISTSPLGSFAPTTKQMMAMTFSA
jgi:hypothetical protein